MNSYVRDLVGIGIEAIVGLAIVTIIAGMV